MTKRLLRCLLFAALLGSSAEGRSWRDWIGYPLTNLGRACSNLLEKLRSPPYGIAFYYKQEHIQNLDLDESFVPVKYDGRYRATWRHRGRERAAYFDAKEGRVVFTHHNRPYLGRDAILSLTWVGFPPPKDAISYEYEGETLVRLTLPRDKVDAKRIYRIVRRHPNVKVSLSGQKYGIDTELNHVQITGVRYRYYTHFFLEKYSHEILFNVHDSRYEGTCELTDYRSDMKVVPVTAPNDRIFVRVTVTFQWGLLKDRLQVSAEFFEPQLRLPDLYFGVWDLKGNLIDVVGAGGCCGSGTIKKRFLPKEGFRLTVVAA